MAEKTKSETPVLGPPASASTPRLVWVDHLRTLMIVLVVNMHACVTCSHVGSWYVMIEPEPPPSVKFAFLVWQGHVQSFFMGLLFFLAGCFAQRSLARRGVAGFLRERATRLGVPALLYMLLVHPFIIFVLLRRPHVAPRPSLLVLYEQYVTSGAVFSGSGPMWFVLALLVFSAALAATGSLWTQSKEVAVAPRPAPGATALINFGIALVLLTFAVRLFQPLGTDILNFQLGFFPQYIVAFIVGVMAGRAEWLEPLARSRHARIAGWLALMGGPLLLVTVATLGGPPPERGANAYAGGWHGQAFGLAWWEQLTGLGLGLGLLALFRRRFNGDSRLGRWLSDRSFAVYVLHAPVLVALTAPLQIVPADPFTRAALLTVVGVLASLAVAEVARRIPGLRRIL